MLEIISDLIPLPALSCGVTSFLILKLPGQPVNPDPSCYFLTATHCGTAQRVYDNLLCKTAM